MKGRVMVVSRKLSLSVLRSRLVRSWLYWMLLQFPLPSRGMQTTKVVQLPKVNEIFAKFEIEAAMNKTDNKLIKVNITITNALRCDISI